MSVLITTFAQLQSVIPTIIGNGDIELYTTYLNDAEDYLANEIVGADLFTDLQETHSGSDNTESKWDKALDLCRNIVALKAYHIAIPFLDLIQTQNGFAVASNSNQAPASKERVKALREGVQNRLNDAIEGLLKFMDDNLDLFTVWSEAPSFTQRYDLLIHSARDFQKYININSSHRFYLAVIPLIDYVEDLHIIPSFSADLIDQIKDEIIEDALTDANEIILKDIKNAVVNLTMAEAIGRLAAQVDPDGVKLNYSMGETSISDVNRNKALSDRYEQQGFFYLRKAIQYMLGHLTDFSAYTSSDVYVDQTAGYAGYTNSESGQTFVAGI